MNHIEESDPVVAMRALEWGPVGMQHPLMPAQALWGTAPMHPNVYLPGPMRNSQSCPSHQAAGIQAVRTVQNQHFHEDRSKWAKKSNASGQSEDAPISGVLCYSVASKKTMTRLGVSGMRTMVLSNVSYPYLSGNFVFD